uniref:Odorant binding protein n=1 Tax=Athetis dissimilis TaxID=1737331 RepID=A0A4D6Q5X3_ATHDI|nr:odorant binding protein [Athetis dissimilis]
MVKFSVVCLYFAVVAVNLWDVNCVSDEEKEAIIKAITPIAEDCAKDCGLSDKDKKKKGDEDDMDPCFKKCLLQSLGLLDEDGKYDRELLRDSIKEYTGDKEAATKVQDQLDACFDANGDNSGDDEESQMKRVDVMFKCLKEIKE